MPEQKSNEIDDFLDVNAGPDVTKDKDKGDQDDDKSKKRDAQDNSDDLDDDLDSDDQDGDDQDDDDDQDSNDDDDSDDSDDDDDDDGDDSDDQDSEEVKQLKTLLEEGKQERLELMKLIAKGNKEPDQDDKDSDDTVTIDDLLTGEQFKSLSKTMQWDESEEAAFSGFLKGMLEQYEDVVSERLLGKMPTVVSGAVTEQRRLTKIKDKFYKDNSELATVKRFIGVLAKQVAEETGEKDLEKVLTLTAERAYKTLGIKKKVKGKSKEDSKPGKGKKKPAFASSKGARKKDKKKKGKSSEISDMLDVMS